MNSKEMAQGEMSVGDMFLTISEIIEIEDED